MEDNKIILIFFIFFLMIGAITGLMFGYQWGYHNGYMDGMQDLEDAIYNTIDEKKKNYTPLNIEPEKVWQYYEVCDSHNGSNLKDFYVENIIIYDYDVNNKSEIDYKIIINAIEVRDDGFGYNVAYSCSENESSVGIGTVHYIEDIYSSVEMWCKFKNEGLVS